MSVRITDNTRLVELDLVRKGSLFLRFLLDLVEVRADPITPKDQGNLRRDKLKQVLGNKAKIEWRKVYASPQERGIVGGKYSVRRYTTAGTGKAYAEKGVGAAVKEAESAMRKARLI